MASLITAAQALAILPGLSAADALAVGGLVAAATRAVERHCRTGLALGSYDEQHRPGPTRTIRLRNRFVVPGTVSLRTDLNTILAVRCIDPAAQRATATLTATSLTLASYSASAPGPTVLALAAYPTCGQLAAAISATPGWSATLGTGRAGWLTADLLPNPGPVGALGVAAGLTAFTRDLTCWAMDRPELGVIELIEDWPEAFRFPDRAYGGHGLGTGYGPIGGADPRRANVRGLYSAGFDPLGLAAPLTPEDLQLGVALTIRGALDSGQYGGMVTSANLGNTTIAVGEQLVVPRGAIALLSPYVKRSL